MSSSLPSSRTFIVAFFLLLLIFAVLEYANLSLVFSNITHNANHYIGSDEHAKIYNESVFLAESGDFTGAKSVLSPLLNQQNLENPRDVFELYGDLVYQGWGASGDIIPFYRRALEHGENLRIEKKIAMLESSWENERTGTGEPIDPPVQGESGDFSSGAMSREVKQQELEQLQKNRKGMVNFSSPLPGDEQQQVREIFEVLGGGEEKKEW